MRRGYMVLFIVLNLIITNSLFGVEKIKIVTGEWPPYVSKNMANNGIIGEIVKESFKEEGVDVDLYICRGKEGKWK